MEEDGGDEALVQRLAEARRRLAAIKAEQSQALGRVNGPLGGGKRDHEGEPKDGDQDGDVDMVPPLTALQVVTLFAGRIREAEEQVRHCQILLAREEVTPEARERETTAMADREDVTARTPAAPTQVVDVGRAADRGGEAGQQDEGDQRGRPRRRPGYTTWVTAEEEEEARAEEQRAQRHWRDGRQLAPQRPRTASREEGPGRCRWSSGTRRTAEGRQRSAGVQPAGDRGWQEVEREFSKLQRAGEDLESRVRDNWQVAQQERMQQLQEAEGREVAMARVAEAAREIEARLEGAPEGRLPREQAGTSAGGEALAPAHPTFGPTGQRLDEQQNLLRAAAVGAAAERGGAAVRPPSVPKRRTRWGDESEAEEEGGRERSPRGARAPRVGRGAMEA